jgi:hypothetical protein
MVALYWTLGPVRLKVMSSIGPYCWVKPGVTKGRHGICSRAIEIGYHEWSVCTCPCHIAEDQP